MKAAAPQAPGSTLHSPKTRAKGLPAPATSAGAGAFAGVLAKAVAASRSATAAPATSARTPDAGTAAQGRQALAARGKTAGRDAARHPGQRRGDEAPAAERGPAEQAAGRTAAVSALPAPAATPAAETRAAASLRRSEPRVQVVDLRKKPAAAEAGPGRSGRGSATEKADGPAPAAKPFAERLAANDPAAKPPALAQPTPLERIRQMAGADLVRTAGIVVRDGGGEIRLTLKPESLGSVRIRLSLEDGRVEGRIVVDTAEARQAFEAGIEGLTRALQADGFQTGQLQVSVSGGNANDSRQASGLLGDTIRGARLRASDEARESAVLPAAWTGGGDGLVNVFA